MENETLATTLQGIGYNLRDIRRRYYGQSISDAAKEIGISTYQLYKLEHGQYEELSMHILDILSEYYRVTICDLVREI